MTVSGVRVAGAAITAHTMNPTAPGSGGGVSGSPTSDGDPESSSGKYASASSPPKKPIPATPPPPRPHQQQENQQSSSSSSSSSSAAPPRPAAKPAVPSPASSVPSTTTDRQIIGDYALGETIGKGTFGKVKLGVHLLTGEKVAIKILEKKRIIEVADVERVAREIQILQKNRHLNVIQLFQVIDAKDQIFLIMEYVDSGEMFEYIVAHHRIREQEAVGFFQQIVDGLEYLHQNEVTHRDLKPENLLLQSCGSASGGFLVKIVDFGLSNTHDGGRLLKTACGSPCYAAPEMIQGKMYKGPGADIWSLGVVLFAMVCGYLPFEDSNTNLLYKKILSADYKMPPFLSHAVQDLIRRILETNPEKRYTVEMIRLHPWFQSASASRGGAESTPRGVAMPTADDPRRRSHILSQLATLGLDPEDVLDAIQRKAHNRLTAAYYLLYNKSLRLRKESFQHPQPQSRPQPQLQQPLAAVDQSEKANGTPRRPQVSAKELVPVRAPVAAAAVGVPNDPIVAPTSGSHHHHHRRRSSDAHAHATTALVVARTPFQVAHASPRSTIAVEPSPSGTQAPGTVATSTSSTATGGRRPSSVRSGRNLVFLTNDGGTTTPGGGAATTTLAPHASHPHRPQLPPGTMTTTGARPPSSSQSGGGLHHYQHQHHANNTRVSISNGMVALSPLALPSSASSAVQPFQRRSSSSQHDPSTNPGRPHHHTTTNPSTAAAAMTQSLSGSHALIRKRPSHHAPATSAVSGPSVVSPPQPATTLKEDDTRAATVDPRRIQTPHRPPPPRGPRPPSSSGGAAVVGIIPQ